MELPSRDRHDVFAPPGRYGELETAIARRVGHRDIPVLFVYAFDYRTRLGPFLFIDKMLVPGSPSAVGAALQAAGFRNVRLVLQQWSPQVRPSAALLDGQRPEVLLISSMQCHSAAAYELIRDAWTLGAHRPLILAGGPKAIYEPWDFFGLSNDGRVGADAVVTGEQFVLLELIDRILESRGADETMRQGFERARRQGLLDDVAGLVYSPEAAAPTHLIDTGVQRLVRDLDEFPSPVNALGLFEPRHRRKGLSARATEPSRLGRQAKVFAVDMTHGCKFRCHYCPIPAYNQFTFRSRSPQRIVEEMKDVAEQSGIRLFFGTDDNFFNNRPAVEAIFSAMASATIGGKPFRRTVRFATEATEFDVYKHRDLVPLARDAGLRKIWFGVEDLTAELIKKGQNPDRTVELFRLLLQHGIGPNPMLIYHDGQPLWTPGRLYGLLNQVAFLRRAGAISVQVTFLTPSPGTKSYEQPYRDGLVMRRVGNRLVENYHFDGNHCVATRDGRPWRRQLDVNLCYAWFYNPFNLLRAALTIDRVWDYRMVHQLLGNLRIVWSLPRVLAWTGRLMRGPIEKHTQPPAPTHRLVAPASAGSETAS